MVPTDTHDVGRPHAVQEALSDSGGWRCGGRRHLGLRTFCQRRRKGEGEEGTGDRCRDAEGIERRRGQGLVTDKARRSAADAWAFRAKVEQEAAVRFDRLAAVIAEFEPGLPGPRPLRRELRV